MSFPLSWKVGLLAVVTGASHGIGYELAQVFAEHGFDLVVAAEDPGIVEASEAFARKGVTSTPVQTDLSSQQGVQSLYEKVRKLGRPVDTLVCNAGVGLGGEFRHQELKRILELLNLNVVSTVSLTRMFLPQFVEKGHGRILFTSSIAADMPGPFEAIYAASKSFVQSFSQALREELKDTGIVVTALQPGPTETDFFRRADMMDTKAGSSEKDSPAQVAEQGFEALMKGQDHVVAGSLMNKVQSVVAKFMPETMQARSHEMQTRPGSQERT